MATLKGLKRVPGASGALRPWPSCAMRRLPSIGPSSGYSPCSLRRSNVPFDRPKKFKNLKTCPRGFRPWPPCATRRLPSIGPRSGYSPSFLRCSKVSFGSPKRLKTFQTCPRTFRGTQAMFELRRPQHVVELTTLVPFRLSISPPNLLLPNPLLNRGRRHQGISPFYIPM